MAQRSLFWDTEGLGDGGPYSQANLHDQFLRCILGATGNRGVVPGWRDGLLVSGTSSPLSVAAGGAAVYGLLHDSDAAVSVSLPTPSAGHSRYDRVVLRRSWAEQTIRVARVAGVAGVIPVVPALTQSPGAIYEVPLATALVTDAGTVTLTDAREFLAFPTAWPAGIVGLGDYAEGAVGAAEIPNRTRYELKGGGSIRPDATNPCTWTAGGSYDYWEFADAATNAGWVTFMAPVGLVGSVNFYLWSVPDVNGAGGGAENAQWDYSAFYGAGDVAPTNATGTVNADQQARVNTRVYRDQLIAALPATEGQPIALQVSRDGAADSYNSAMRLLGVEMEWTADS
jgi:hypothetical protein